MILLYLALLLVYDVYVTYHLTRSLAYKELNFLIVTLDKYLGPFGGVLLGLLIPNLCLIGLLYWFKAEKALYFLAGLRTMLALKQLLVYGVCPERNGRARPLVP